MRLLASLGLVTILAAAVPAVPCGAAGEAEGNFYTRLRANDAPIGGRFTIFAYMLDTLDTARELPGPGRLLAVHFREANGKNSFLVPGDLHLQAGVNFVWREGFVPLTDRRLAGLLPRGESRWALWFIPLGSDSLPWTAAGDLKLGYGLSRSSFVPLEDADALAMVDVLPWDRILAADLEPGRPVERLAVAVDPAVFDQPPVVLLRKNPRYPRSSRMFDFEGTVHVAAHVNEEGRVTDAVVLHSDAAHELNISALTAVMDWVFQPGTKSGRPVAGETIVPMRFSLRVVK